MSKPPQENNRDSRSGELPLANSGQLIGRDEAYSVWQTEAFRWVQEGDAIQSMMLRDKPASLVLPNHHYMLVALAFARSPQRLLNLGFGLGAIERKLQNDFGEIDITSVESSPAMVRIAKQYFHISADTRIQEMTAENFLHRTCDTFDVVIVDLFNQGRNATCLYQAEFYSRLATRMKKHAWVAINVIPSDDEDLLSMLLPLRRCFPVVALAPVPNRQNFIVLASDALTGVELPSIPMAVEKFGYNVRELSACFTRLPEPV